MAASRTIIVAGAGIGGLTAALALAARGFRVIVLERAERLEEAGAGLQLSPNASRILIDLGIESVLGSRAFAPEAISIMSARRGREIARIPLGEAAAFRYGAPYWMVRRADLQAALAKLAGDNPDIDIRLGAQFEDVAVYSKGVTVVQRQGAERKHEAVLALIGADGIWSAVRHHLFPDFRPRFTGRIAWRATVEAKQLPRAFKTRRVQLWMGADAHLVAYPVAGGDSINLVAITTGAWNRPGWSEPADAPDIAGQFDMARWPIAARMMVGAAHEWRKWALFALPDGGVWHSGPIALLGDAAHAMLPFVAQGAGMAIEDAAVIAKCLQHGQDNIPAAFERYGNLRRARIHAMQRTSRRTGSIYHMSGAMALARDTVISILGGKRLLARQDWIYDWRA